jgi:putative aldouronate transport system substrate-binding protein
MNKRSIGFFWVLLVLGVAMVFGGGQQSQSGSSTGFGPRGTGPNYWLAKYEKPVTLHVVNRSRTVDRFAGSDSVSSNAWTRGMKEMLNIDIVTDWVSSETEYTTRLNLAIASKQLPDVYLVNNVQFRQLMEAGLCADITDYIENNASDTLKKVMAYAPEVLETAKQNGRLYAMPTFGYGPYPAPNSLCLRHDWMEDAGVSIPPKTIAELENLMKIMMQKHPGTYGMPLDRDLREMYLLAPGFKAYPENMWLDKNGTIVYGAVQPEMREVLRTFADWYSKGYLKKDFMSMDDAAVRQDVVSGQVGIEMWYQYWGYNRGIDVVNNLGKNAYFDLYEMPSADGKPVIHPMYFDNGGYLVVNKNCKNIDAAIKSMSFIHYIYNDAILQKILTPQDILPYLFENNEGLHVMQMFKIMDPVSEGEEYEQVQAAIRAGGPAGIKNSAALIKYNGAKTWADNGDPTGIGYFLQVYGPHCAYHDNDVIVKEKRFVYTAMMGAPPEVLANYGSTLDDLLKEGFTKIIIGAEPLSYFDTLVNEWKAAGGDTATAAVNKEFGKK